MPFLKGQKPPEGSGRPTGSKNKFSLKTARELAEKHKFDPLEGLIKMGAERSTPKALKIQCMRFAAKYLHPELRSVEHSGAGGGPIQHAVSVDWSKLTDDQLLKAKELADALGLEAKA